MRRIGFKRTPGIFSAIRARVVLLMLSDALCASGIFFVVLWGYRLLGDKEYELDRYWNFLPFLLVFLSCNTLFRCYHGSLFYPGICLNKIEEIRRISFAVFVTYLLSFTWLMFSRSSEHFSRFVLVFSMCLTIPALPVTRFLSRYLMQKLGIGQINILIAGAGVSSALQIFGVLFGVVIVTGGLLSMRCPPGFAPEGWTPPAGRAATGTERNWRAMLASSEFPPMILLLMCGAIAAMMVIAHVFSIARDQMAWGAAEASAAVSVIALANTFGRIFAGTLSDRLGRLPALSLGLSLSLLGLAALALSGPESRALFYVGLAAVGLSFGSFMGVFPGYTAEVFGSRNNSVNFGIMFAGFSVAGIAGPALMGTMRAAGFGYPLCYLAGGLISAAGFLCILRLYGLRRKPALA